MIEIDIGATLAIILGVGCFVFFMLNEVQLDREEDEADDDQQEGLEK